MKFENINVGDVLCLISYVTVESRNSSYGLESRKSIEVKDLDTDQEYTVSGQKLIERFYSADQHEKEEKLTKTKLAELFVTQTKNLPFTVVFEKKDGSERVLRGRMVSSDGFLGYSMVIDLDKKEMRQVNHNTIKKLILNNVQYSLKK